MSSVTTIYLQIVYLPSGKLTYSRGQLLRTSYLSKISAPALRTLKIHILRTSNKF